MPETVERVIEKKAKVKKDKSPVPASNTDEIKTDPQNVVPQDNASQKKG